MSSIHGSLAAAEDHNLSILAKLLAASELRRVNHERNSLHANDLGNTGNDVETSAECYGVASICKGASVGLADRHDVTYTVVAALDVANCMFAVDEMAKLKLVDVVVEILDICFGRDEVGSSLGETKVGEGSQVLGRDKLLRAS